MIILHERRLLLGAQLPLLFSPFPSSPSPPRFSPLRFPSLLIPTSFLDHAAKSLAALKLPNGFKRSPVANRRLLHFRLQQNASGESCFLCDHDTLLHQRIA